MFVEIEFVATLICFDQNHKKIVNKKMEKSSTDK